MTQSTTIRVSKEIYDTVKLIAQQHDQKIQEVIEQAIREYKKKQFFDDVNFAYSALRENKTAWHEEETERLSWDSSSADLLEKKHGRK
jgi:predicted transcriptional regulator